MMTQEIVIVIMSTVVIPVVLGIISNLATDRVKRLKANIENADAGKREGLKWSAISLFFCIFSIIGYMLSIWWITLQPWATSGIGIFGIVLIAIGFHEATKPILVQLDDFIRRMKEF